VTIQTRHVDYKDGHKTCEAYVAWDDAGSGPRPGVLVSHAWRGRSEFDNEQARRLAAAGYVGFALDLYGKGVTGSSNEENSRLMQPFMKDRAMLADCLHTAHAEMRELPEVDAARTAAIGFCFGGLCVLDLARSGAELAGVVSFHGLLKPNGLANEAPFTAKVLVLHGWDDPLAPPDEVLALGRELSERQCDWQLHAYGNTRHAFTNPQANDVANGLVYRPLAAGRAFALADLFLVNLFE